MGETWRRATAALAALAAALVVLATAAPTPAQGQEAQPLAWPLTGSVISVFGDCRGSGCSRSHDGYDLHGPEDIPVYASAAGTVFRADNSPQGYGLFVEIDHGGGWSTLYSHLNAQSVVAGQPVAQGEQIGLNGDTGNAAGTPHHVHWELRRYSDSCPPHNVSCSAQDLNAYIDRSMSFGAREPMPVPGSALPGFPPSEAPPPSVDRTARLAGPDRVATAVEVSKQRFPDDGTARHVFVASAGSFPDAVAAAAMAGSFNGSVLLTGGGERLEPSVRDELRRVLASGRTRAWFLGGRAALPESKLEDATEARRVTRVGGGSRFGTAALAAKHVLNHRGARSAVLANGSENPDTSPLLAVAASRDWPVLLTPRGRLNRKARRVLVRRGIRRVHVAGPRAQISRKVVRRVRRLKGVRKARRHFAETRFHTAALVGNRFFPTPENFLVASGADWPDAVVGAPWAGNELGAPVLLSEQERLSAPAADYVRGRRSEGVRGFLIGGTAALGDQVQADLRALLP